MRYRFGFAMEHTLGHVTFARALQKVVAEDDQVEAEWFLVEPQGRGLAARTPVLSRNYTLRTSATARAMVGRGRRLDALLLHTQTLGLFFWPLMGRVPTVISTDATPLNIDAVGAAYGHAQAGTLVEGVKRRLTGSLFRRAAWLVPWSEWAERSLVHDYAVAPERCRVVQPGVDVAWWAAGRAPAPVGDEGTGAGGAEVSVVFVGGDFERKGGNDLLAAVGELRRQGLAVRCDLVTRQELPDQPGVRVHRGLRPGDPALRDLVARADIFALPTRGDALGLAIVEAMAAGVPVVSTEVAAIPEVVRPGTGLLVPPGDVAALVQALRHLVVSPGLRRQMGREAHAVAAREHDLSRSGRALLDLLKAAVRQ